MSAVPARRTVYLWLLLGTFACSTAVIWIRLSATPPLLLAGWRLLLSALLLAPFACRAWKTATPEHRRHSLWGTLLPGAILALHFILWTQGARMIEAARATLIVNMMPVAMPFVLWMISRERVNRGEALGTAVALAGVLLLTVPKLKAATGVAAGDWVCFAAMLCIAVYLGFTRRYRDRGSFWLYLVPVYSWAALFCLAVALPWHGHEMLPPAREWIWLAALAVIPTLVGHGLLNFSLRHVGGQQVSVCSQSQFLFSAVMAFFLFGEVPDLLFYPAALLIVAGSILTARAMPSGSLRR
jgi:drug/metabolite transporter (DMT)-like permease